MYLLVIATWSCNLNCTYCGVQKKNLYISEDYLRKSIDLLLTSSHRELKLELFGGEPLMLPFELIKKTILYGEKKAGKIGKKIDFIITTNGILLDKEKIKFFKEHNTLLILSLDGLRKSQNINRPQVGNKDSYSLIVKNLPLIFKERLKCYCYTVITPETVSRLYDNIAGLVRLGFRNIWMMMACGPLWRKDKTQILRKNLQRVSGVYPSMLKDKGVVLLNLKNWLSPFRMNTELSVNIDGCLYSACLSYLIKNEETRKKYVIGHIDNINTSIDELEKKRLTNEQAMEVIYRENNIYKSLPSNIRAGKVFADFSEKLRNELKNKNLWNLYEELVSVTK